MFTDMFAAIEEKRDPLETFYDGYVVNAILDAAYKSAGTKKWEPVILEDWRGDPADTHINKYTSYDDRYYLIKEEILPNGDAKLILKDKDTGEVVQRITN
jgi:hypothetical protein